MPVTSVARVDKIIDISDSIKEFILIPDKYLRYEPGQFLQLAFGEVKPYDLWPDSRAFSIASPYKKEGKYISVIVKKGKEFTKKLFENISVGCKLTIRYPFGDFLIEDNTERLIFIAGGTGISPFLSYIRSLQFRSFVGEIYLYYSTGYKKDLIHLEELLESERKYNKFYAKIFLTKEQNVEDNLITYRRMIIDDVIDKGCSKGDMKIYICGPEDFTRQVAKAFQKKNINNLYFEEW
jgi:ferredoxin-NADP reductase